MNKTDFAALIKQKYPDYQDIDDSVLVERVLQKYPEYREMVMDEAPTGGLPTPQEMLAQQNAGVGMPGAAPADASLTANQGAKPGQHFQVTQGVDADNPEIARALAPRVYAARDQGAGIKQELSALGADMLSLPGRMLASTPDAIGSDDAGGAMVRGMTQTKGEGVIGNIVRSPAMGAAVAAAPFTGGASLGALAGASAAGAAGTQLENVGEGREFSATEAFVETGLGIAGGKAAQLAFKGLGKAVSKGMDWVNEGATRIGKNRSYVIAFKEAKPTETMRRNGFKLETLRKHDIGGDLAHAQGKASSKVAEATSRLESVLDDAAKKGGESAKIDVNDLINTIKAEPAWKHVHKDVIEKQIRPLIDNIAPDGKMDVVQSTQLKRAIGELRDWGASQKDLSAKDRLLGRIYDKVRDATNQTAESLGGDVRSINRELNELIPVENVLTRRVEAAIDETAVGAMAKLKKMAKEALDPGGITGGLVAAGAVTAGVPAGAVIGGKLAYNLSRMGLDKLAKKVAENGQVVVFAKKLGIPKSKAAEIFTYALLTGRNIKEVTCGILNGDISLRDLEAAAPSGEDPDTPRAGADSVRSR